MLKGKLKHWDDRLHQRAPVFWKFVKYRFKRGERYGLAFTLAFLIVLACTWAFLFVAESIAAQQALYRFDFTVQRFMSGLLSPELTAWFIFITDLGGNRGTMVGAIAVCLVLLFMRRWWDLFGMAFATAGGGLLQAGLKLFFERARPAEKVIDAGGFSFPSGHATAAMVFFGYLIYLAWKDIRSLAGRLAATVVCVLMILLIGVSRVYLNVHWLTDVMGGFTAGFVWLCLSIYIVRTVEAPPWRKKHHLHLPDLHREGDDPDESGKS